MILALTTSNEPGAVQSKTLLVWLASLAIENESCMRMRTIKLSSQCIVASTLGWWKDECFTCLSDFEIPPLWLWDEKIWLCRQTPSEIEKIFFLILKRMRICWQTPSEIEKIFFLILLRLRKFFFSFSWDWDKKCFGRTKRTTPKNAKRSCFSYIRGALSRCTSKTG